MVFHQEKERTYWTLPGGAVEADETPEEAVIREVKEETGLKTKISKFLFDEAFGDNICRCFLMEVDKDQQAQLGYDPEENHLESKDKMLQDILWHSLESMKNDCQVSLVINKLQINEDLKY